MTTDPAPGTTPSNVVLHPVLRAQAERLLRDPALSFKVRREIRQQLGLEPPSPPSPVQLSSRLLLSVISGARFSTAKEAADDLCAAADHYG